MSIATAPVNETVSNSTPSAQNETALSDLEILQRVREIRSSWSISERIERRNAASERFASLMDALQLDIQAA